MSKTNEFDVLIVGAGISGISAAWHVQKKCPGKTYALLENRKAMGGTWDLFRYPGIRSDSDMHTMGFAFKPWNHPKAISDGKDIREYIEETAAENGIDKHIHFNHKVISARWDSANSRWTVVARNGRRKQEFRCNFLHMCAGYFNYDKGYLPDFPGYADFGGELVHPQHWPKDLNYANKRVVIIGSGATAVTLLPSIADKATHVTMLQRSPTYMISAPAIDPVSARLRRILPHLWAYRIIRTRNILLQRLLFWRSKSAPVKVKAYLLDRLRKELGDDYDIEKHFTPAYNPWDQRLCLVPDSDFFAAIRSGKADVVTEQIDTFTKTGIQLKSGEHLQADLIVTATGLNMQIMQDIDFVVDGKPVAINEQLIYKGAMLSNVPNLAFTMGYSNASWTLKADLTSKWICRILNHMRSRGHSKCVPALRDENIAADTVMNLNSGYVQRAIERVPKQGAVAPWKLLHNYLLDQIILGFKPIADGVMEFSGQPSAAKLPGSGGKNKEMRKAA